MFIHLGEETVIRSDDVIAIIDSQLLDSVSIMNEFLEGQKLKDNIIKISDGYVKSIVVTSNQVYFSPLSSLTLKRRAQMISELDSIENL